MDYEKAYKAVLKTATQWIKDGCTDKEKICLESVFPELAESEDERIRKEIISIVKEYGRICEKEGDPCCTINDCLAYLEKQKEQKHPNGCFTCDEYKKGYEEGRRNGFTAGYNKAMKEVEQKEQKPAEWSEEDEKMLVRIIERGQSQIPMFETGLLPEHIAWLKSLRNRLKKPEIFDTVAFQKGVQEGRRLEREDALTIADIEKLHTFLYAVKNNKQGAFTFTRLTDEQYEEVLRRFNNAKKK